VRVIGSSYRKKRSFVKSINSELHVEEYNDISKVLVEC
jgi:hypothetical protein